MNQVFSASLLTIFVITGCSNGKSETPSVGQASADDSITGLWTSVIEGETDDYFEVSTNNLVLYTYQESNASEISNCYIVESKVLTNVGETLYTLDGGLNEIGIQAVDDILSISYIDVNDFDDDGDLQETLVDKYNKVENISSLDLMRCS